MKYMIVAVTASALLFTAGMAHAKLPAMNLDGLYVQGDVGSARLNAKASYATHVSDYSGNDTAFRVAAGKDFGNIRVALDYTDMGKLDLDGQWHAEITAKSVGLSGIYDFNSNSAFVPYAGVRLAHNKLRLDSDLVTGKVTNKNSDTGFGALVGVQYRLNGNVALNANLEYNDLGKLKAGANADVTNTSVYVGARYNF